MIFFILLQFLCRIRTFRPDPAKRSGSGRIRICNSVFCALISKLQEFFFNFWNQIFFSLLNKLKVKANL